MKLLLLGIMLLLIFPAVSLAANGCQTGWTTGTVCNVKDASQVDSCALTDVNAALAMVSPGDTVKLPTCPSNPTVWTSYLCNGKGTAGVCWNYANGGWDVIGRGVIIQGNGVANTVIQREGYAIFWQASPDAMDANESLTIKDMTFDGNDTTTGSGLLYINTVRKVSDGTFSATNVYISGNKFQNATVAIYMHGLFYGYTANNTFERICVPEKYAGTDGVGGVDGRANWAKITQVYGSENSHFFEDNTIQFSTSANTMCGVSGAGNLFGWIETGQGSGPYVVRYNTWDQAGTYPNNFFDIHGLQNGSQYDVSVSIGSPCVVTSASYEVFDGEAITFNMNPPASGSTLPTGLTRGVRYFAKKINSTTFNVAATLGGDSINTSGSQSGQHAILAEAEPNCLAYSGMAVEYYGNKYINVDTNTSSIWMEHRGGWLLMFNNSVTRSGAVDDNWLNYLMQYYCDQGGSTGYGCNYGSDQYVQNPTNAYSWNNRQDGVDKPPAVMEQSPGCPSVPLTENTHYWKYNASFDPASASNGIGCGSATPSNACTTGSAYWKTSQSCSDMSTMVGVSPASPISGTLYQCQAGSWVSYFTPYTYPHPLRGETPVTGGITLGSGAAIKLNAGAAVTLE
jgi:hypothetical protein